MTPVDPLGWAMRLTIVGDTLTLMWTGTKWVLVHVLADTGVCGNSN